jgi:hypothetical protein
MKEEKTFTIRDTKHLFNIIGSDKVFSLLTSDIPQRVREILQMSWKDNMTHKDIAEHFGLSLERVRQLYNRGVRRFKANVNQAINEYEHLKNFMEEMENLRTTNNILREENLIFKRRFDALSPNEKITCGHIDVLKQRIIDFDFDVRSMNCLRYSDINTMEELVQFSRNDLMKFRNLGKSSIDKIEDLLKGLGLKLNDRNIIRF